ncbi:MAG: nitronate monooxygenase, partial [Corynebacterium nuruki]|nr:nitronate monooxygenase [Corynebacterium nuruki]
MSVLSTRLTRMWGCDLPVIGAPMAGRAGGELAAAVSAAGGLGM